VIDPAPFCEPGWPPDPTKLARPVRDRLPEVSFRYAGQVLCAPPTFQFARPDGRVIADCPSFASVMAAHRLLTGLAAVEMAEIRAFNAAADMRERIEAQR
jgi:hypothetical protein